MVVVTLGARRAGVEVDWLYRRYGRDVQRYAQRVLRSAADADDVVQLTFVRALRALDRGAQVERPQHWLIKIAHNECRRLVASRKRTVELPEDLVAEVDPSPVSSEEFTHALKVLAPAQRQALVLRELEGRSYTEIAETMGLSPSAVETLLFRARRAVREQLESAVSCEEFPALLESGERARVRAHARVCEPCAKLERSARGKKSRLSRIASSLFLPKWLAGLFATGATVATVATVVAAAPPAQRVPDVTPLQVDKAVPAVVVSAPARPHPVAAKKRTATPVSDTEKVSGTVLAPVRVRASEPTIPPGPEPLPVPEPTEPGPPPVPAPPIHSVRTPAPAPAPAPAPLPHVVAPVVTPVAQAVAPVLATVDTTLQSVAPTVTVPEAPVQAVQNAVAPVAHALPTLPNVSGP